MALNFDGRLYLIKNFGEKISGRNDAPFTCGFCSTMYSGSERYSTMRAQADDDSTLNFIFCRACVTSAITDFPGLPNPAVPRALILKIERDGAAVNARSGHPSP